MFPEAIMKRLLSPIVCALLATLSPAQQSGPATQKSAPIISAPAQGTQVTPEGGASRDDILKMLDAMNAREQSMSVLKTMVPQMQEMSRRMIDSEIASMNAKQRQIYQKHMDNMTQSVFAEM